MSSKHPPPPPPRHRAPKPLGRQPGPSRLLLPQSRDQIQATGPPTRGNPQPPHSPTGPNKCPTTTPQNTNSPNHRARSACIRQGDTRHESSVTESSLLTLDTRSPHSHVLFTESTPLRSSGFLQ